MATSYAVRRRGVEGFDTMKVCTWLFVGVLALAGCDGTNRLDMPLVPEGKLPGTERGNLPVILTDKKLGAMEAIIEGTLVRRGPCFYFDNGPEDAVIVWEEGTTINSADERGLTILLRSGLRITEGDTLRGGGGHLPSGLPISDFTNEPVPDECATGDAVQLHSVEIVETVRRDDPEVRPPPPPPAPVMPSFLDSVKNHDTAGGAVAGVIRGVDDPREALFIRVLSDIRDEQGHRNSPACLREIDDALFARLSQRFDELYRASECRWSDGGVVLRRDEKGAVFVSANLDCDGKDHCVAEGARVYGNVGGEGLGYILRPVAGGWEIRTVAVSWMS
ncbi:hypothetical protein GRI44_02335 [Altererythrobacter confluentis]|uniref:Uncharacterized protein n=1 Tax=Allopontixanthobacter confluentis TaxID=1849021 RepID=A0A6L7GC16_9SPHN|nr:hypothetical protein [Allopontixanthobacter confluentis]MXP13592.1 hypothetical protein [Allopontixanthobacter confluentis]